jgi:hypothetical protein
MRVLIALPSPVIRMERCSGRWSAGHDEVGAQRAPVLDEWLWPPSAQGRQLLQSSAGACLLEGFMEQLD